MAPKLDRLHHETTGLKLFALFTLLGWVLIGLALIVFVAVLAPLAATYWGGNAKAVRDAAEIGRPLIAQLSTLAWWPKLLKPVIILGVASFMVGIAMEFAAIPRLLERRTELLSRAVPLMGSRN